MNAARLTRIAVVVLCLVACSDGGDGSLDAGQASEQQLPAEAKDRLTWSIESEAAAFGDEVLIVGGLGPGEEGHVLPDSALRVDLASGDATEVQAPGGDAPILVDDAIADASGFVVVGSRCDPVGLLADDWECNPGSGASFRLDDRGEVWTRLPLPEEVSPPDPATPWQFDASTDVTPDGRAFMVVSAGPGYRGDLHRLLVLDGDRWVHVADDVSTGSFMEACATSDGVYVLSRVGNPRDPASGPNVAENGGPPPATLSLVRVSLDGAAPVPVDLPAIDTSFDGAGVEMACDRNGPYVTSNRPDPSPETDTGFELYTLRHGTWRPIDGDFGDSRALSVSSAADGVTLVLDDGAANPTIRAFAVAATSETARELGGDSGLRDFLPDPATGGFVAIGPFPAVAGRADAPVPDPEEITALPVAP